MTGFHRQHGECNQAMSEPLTTILPGNLLVVNTLSQAVSGNYMVRIVNMGTQDVWLNPRTRLGWLQEVDIEKEEPNKEFHFIQVAVDEVEVNIGFEPGMKSDLDESEETPFPCLFKNTVGQVESLARDACKSIRQG